MIRSLRPVFRALQLIYINVVFRFSPGTYLGDNMLRIAYYVMIRVLIYPVGLCLHSIGFSFFVYRSPATILYLHWW